MALQVLHGRVVVEDGNETAEIGEAEADVVAPGHPWEAAATASSVLLLLLACSPEPASPQSKPDLQRRSVGSGDEAPEATGDMRDTLDATPSVMMSDAPSGTTYRYDPSRQSMRNRQTIVDRPSLALSRGVAKAALVFYQMLSRGVGVPPAR
ncbi:MAG TPA: hypothetical protein VGR23_07100 [Candidatus Dormibacteraeota bacterium]|nr:hypothetical protein [Candidatus Dormibacteraeota bacterium]